MTISEQKNKIRLKILEKFSSLSEAKTLSAAHLLQEKTEALSFFKEAKSVALYFPHQNEISILEIDQLARKMGKQIAYPKVPEKSGALQFYWVDSLQSLIKSSWGLLEPDPQSSSPASLDFIELMMIPGLAFDAEGNRLGRGKGFYDKTLKNYQGTRLGLAYDFQILDSLPHENWDEPVHGVLTETRYIKASHA